MTPKIRDLGMWNVYTPTAMPEWVSELPPGVCPIFVRRDNDGVDWYDYRKETNAFTDGYLLATLSQDKLSNLWIIQGVFRDPSTGPVPTGLRLIEIEDINPSDTTPWKQYEQHTFDLSTLTIGDVWVPTILSVQDYQFAGQANAEGILTDQETDDWVGSGIVPKSVIDAVIKTVTETERQRRVLLFLKGAKAFPRFHDLTPLIGAVFGKDTPEKVDAFFLAASKR